MSLYFIPLHYAALLSTLLVYEDTTVPQMRCGSMMVNLVLSS